MRETRTKAENHGNASTTRNAIGVGSLTRSVRRTGAARTASEALAAAQLCVNRLVPVLGHASLLVRARQFEQARETLSGTVAGIRFLAELVAAVEQSTQIETSPGVDQEMGRIALAVEELELAAAGGPSLAIASAIDESLLPALLRLAQHLPQIEARVMALA